MKTENVLYTDGHDVTVTDSALKVRKKWYSLNGIVKHRLLILSPDRLPSLSVLTMGIALIALGVADFMPLATPSIRLFKILLSPNEVAIGVGILTLIGGSVRMAMLSEKYAVNITTAEGDKNVIVSYRKEYVTQIFHALNEAFFTRSFGSTKDTKKEFQVSHR